MTEEPLSFDELVALITRNWRIVATTWNAKEKIQARIVAKVACEQLTQYIEDF